MVESTSQEMATPAMYRNMANFSAQARAVQFTQSKNALNSAQNYFLNQLLNKESELTREIAKG